MRRVYLLSEDIRGNQAIIRDKKIVHYLKDVLRLKKSDEVIGFDKESNEYRCMAEKTGDNITLNIIERQARQDSALKVCVACAIPKNSRFEDIVDKLTQLGVDEIIPLATQRAVVKIDKGKEEARLNRFRKIAVQAAQQSQRSSLPLIGKIESMKEALAKSARYDLKLIPTLAGSRKPLAEALKNKKPKSIFVLIGPEGDFTDEEVEMAYKVGFIPVTLGNLVLRVETAAVAVAAFIRLYKLGDGSP